MQVARIEVSSLGFGDIPAAGRLSGATSETSIKDNVENLDEEMKCKQTVSRQNCSHCVAHCSSLPTPVSFPLG